MITMDPRLDCVRGCAQKARACVEWARTVQITIDVIVWSGGRLGVGTSTHTLDPLPKQFPVQELNNREVSSSGGRFMSGDVKVTEITPPYTSHGGGGFSADRLDPTIAAFEQGTEVFYLLDGEISGIWTLVSLTTGDPVSWSMVLRNTRHSPRDH